MTQLGNDKYPHKIPASRKHLLAGIRVGRKTLRWKGSKNVAKEAMGF